VAGAFYLQAPRFYHSETVAFKPVERFDTSSSNQNVASLFRPRVSRQPHFYLRRPSFSRTMALTVTGPLLSLGSSRETMTVGRRSLMLHVVHLTPRIFSRPYSSHSESGNIRHASRCFARSHRKASTTILTETLKKRKC